jgi:hypothetical protein
MTRRLLSIWKDRKALVLCCLLSETGIDSVRLPEDIVAAQRKVAQLTIQLAKAHTVYLCYWVVCWLTSDVDCFKRCVIHNH